MGKNMTPCPSSKLADIECVLYIYAHKNSSLNIVKSRQMDRRQSFPDHGPCHVKVSGCCRGNSLEAGETDSEP
jgi:hypothetical protein